MAQDVLQVARFRRCHLTIGNLLLRFALGGGLVSFFAALGSCFKPKTFAGLFGAAPPVALVSLGIAFVQQNPAHIRALTSSMVLGAIALCFYSGCCALLIQRKNKRDYVYLADLWTAADDLRNLDAWFDDYNHVRPHKGLRKLSPVNSGTRNWHHDNWVRSYPGQLHSNVRCVSRKRSN